MATIHYEGLDGWRKSAAFWGLLGAVLVIAKSPPLPWVALVILGGAATGGASALWLSRMKPRLISVTEWAGLLVFAGLIYLLTTSHPELKVPALGFFALGCLFQSANRLVFGIAGTRAMKRINAKHSSWLAKLDPPVRKTGPPASRTGHPSNREAFLSALPDPMQREFRDAVVEIIHASPFRSLETLPAIASSLGGSPLIPPGAAWPERNGRPMQFLAQLNLSEIPVPPGTLPPTGLLAIFYDAHEQPWGDDSADLGSTVILHTPDPGMTVPAKHPGEVGPSPLRQPLAFRRDTALVLSDAQESGFYGLLRQFSGEEKAHLSALHDAMLSSEPQGLRVMSPPLRIQGDMDDELSVAASVYGLPEDTSWTLLIQLGSDSDLGWCWGDAGDLYLWCPSADLASGRFDRVWTVLQCH